MQNKLVGILQEGGWGNQKEAIEMHLSQKSYWKKSRVATCEFTTPINVLINASEVFRVVKIKRRSFSISFPICSSSFFLQSRLFCG